MHDTVGGDGGGGTAVAFGGGGTAMAFGGGGGGALAVWQLSPSYPVSHDVHVHDPVVPPTVPPLIQ